MSELPPAGGPAVEPGGQVGRPADVVPDAPHLPAAVLDAGPLVSHMSEAEERYHERWIAFWFLFALCGGAGFMAVVWGFDLHSYLFNPLLGICLAAVLLGLGIGIVLWARNLMGEEYAVQEREPLHPTPEERERTVALFREGVARSGFLRHKLLRRTLLTSATLAPLLVALSALRDLGPRPESGQLTYSGWTGGERLVDAQNVPVKVGDLEIGSYTTVFPEGKVGVALAPTLLIRLGPGVNHPLPGRADWAPDGHIAYSKICTHLGCPVGLYEQQAHVLLCPCHQSQFDVPDGCHVLFGPASRPLPQLNIYIDSQGYFRARTGYTESVGPGFWNRK